MKDKGIRQIICGYDNTFILKNNCKLFAFGYNKHGALGLGDDENDENDENNKSSLCDNQHDELNLADDQNDQHNELNLANDQHNQIEFQMN